MRSRGFTLLEVLIALSIASLSLGAILSDVGRQVIRVNRIEPKYRALLSAGSAAERAAEDRIVADETGMESGREYHLTVRSMAADARIEEVKVTVDGGRGAKVALTTYRLRSISADPGLNGSN